MSRRERVVSRGTIRVDARKAVERLRGHQLIDLHLHALEALRFAAASGASRIDVDYERDTLVLTWNGSPLGQAELERLLDYLLVESEHEEARRPRWLAYAVNAALGLKPEWVQVHSRSESECIAVRWTPESKDGAAPEVRHTAAPDGMPSTGMRLELRRSSGWLSRLFSAGDLPNEVLAMQESTALLGDRLLLKGRPFPRTPRPRALVRAPFSLSCARSCHVEFTQWRSARPTLEWYEQSVRLAALRWHAPPPFPSGPHAGCELPVRVIVDAIELDTNASRSAIRQDSPLLKELPDAAAAAFYTALHALASRVIGAPDERAEVEFLSDDAIELEDALGAAMCVIAGSDYDGPMTRKLREWLELPLLRNVVGKPLPLAPLLGKGLPIKASYGDAPWPEELGPWVDDVLWLRGRTVEKAIDPARLRDAADRLADARQALQRRARFLARPVMGVQLEDSGQFVASVSHTFSESPWDALAVAVALLPPADRTPFVVRVIAEGRLLETVELEPQSFPLPMLAAIEWPGVLVPKPDFDGVRRDEPLDRAIWVAALEGIRLADGLARGLSNADDDQAEALRRLVQGAVQTLTSCTRRLSLAGRVEPPTLQSFEGLYEAPVWLCCDGGFVSSRVLAEYAIRTRAVCFAGNVTRPARDGRPIVVATRSELSWVADVTGVPIEFVYYENALGTLRLAGPDEGRRAEVDRLTMRELEGAPIWMRIDRPGVVGRIAVHGRTLLTRIHAGQVLSSGEIAPELGPVVMTIDDDSIVPRESWDGALYFGSNPELDRDVQYEFAEAVLNCLEGRGASPELEGLDPAPERASPSLVAWLMRIVRRLFQSGDHEQLRARIESLPVLRVLDDNGVPEPATLYWIRGYHNKGSIPYLQEPPGFATLDWRPVLAQPGPVQDALRELFETALVPATAELADRARIAHRERAWEEWDRKPEVDPAEVLGALPGSPMVFERVPSTDESCVQTIAAAMTAQPPVRARVLFRNREVRKLEWRDWDVPMALTIGLAERAQMTAPGELSVQGLDAANLLGMQARLLLAMELVRSLPEGASLPAYPAALAVIASAANEATASCFPELAQSLYSLLLEVWWPTAQGGKEKLKGLTPGPNALRYSRIRFEPWHGPSSAPSELDTPCAWIPQGAEGDRALAIVQFIHGGVEDVTSMLSSLQARRAGTGGGPPRLPGQPSHPLLRRGLEELGIRVTQGEMELADAGAELLVTDLSGEVHGLPWELDVPVRAVARIDDVLTAERQSALIAELDGASRILLGNMLDHLSELPPFVRAIVREVICGKLSRGQELEALEFISAVFPDVASAWHSAAEMSATGRTWAFTTDLPPYPAGHGSDPVLALSAAQSDLLSKLVQLRDETELLRRERAGELKLQQPPLANVGIHGSLRSKCLFVIPISGSGIRGEVGLLAPEFAGCRGVEVHVGRRMLCTLPDGTGYPLLAAVNCDSLVPNRYFDGPQTDSAGLHAIESVRVLASEAFRQWLRASRRAAAARFVEDSRPPEAPLGPMNIAGLFWIPDQWPVAPQCLVRSSLGSSTEPLRVPASSGFVDGIIPVCAEVYVVHEGFERGIEPHPYAWREHVVVRQLAVDALREMLAEAGASLAAAEREAWRWNLALLGDEAPDTSAPCIDGSRIEASRVAGLLRSGVKIALASQPSPYLSASPPVLLDDGSSACRVLRARARMGIDDISSPSATSAERGGSSWLDRIGSTVALAWAGEKNLPAEGTEAQLASALHRLLQALRLSGPPLRAVRVATRGRPVRFRAEDATLLVNTGHDAVRACLALSPESALAMLGAAALAELNRELPAVTDREEATALAHLLEQLASR